MFLEGWGISRIDSEQRERVEGHIDPLVVESKKQTLTCFPSLLPTLFPINYCLMLTKEGGGTLWNIIIHCSISPRRALFPPPLVLSEEAARAVNWVQQAKMSPQPFKEGTAGSRVKDAICPNDIWGETAIYVRSCWKKDRRSRHITLQPFTGWAHSLTRTANTVAREQQQQFFVYISTWCVSMAYTFQIDTCVYTQMNAAL